MGRSNHTNAFYQLLPYIENDAMFNGFNFSIGSRVPSVNGTIQRNQVSPYICPSDLSNSPANPVTTIANNQASYGMNYGTTPVVIWGYGSDSRWFYWCSVKGNGFFGDAGGTVGTFGVPQDGPMKLRTVVDGTSKTFTFGEKSRFVGQVSTFVYTWAQAGWFTAGDPFYTTLGFSYSVPRINGRPSTVGQSPPCITTGVTTCPSCGCNDWLTGYPGNHPSNSEFGEYGFRSLHPGGVNIVMVDGSVQFVNNSIDRFVFAAMSTPQGGETNN
jgi:prepilin-type processing-associated H-X9-DG protein